MRLVAILALLVALLSAAPVSAGPVTLVWDAAAGATATDVDQMTCTGTHPNFVCGPWVALRTVTNATACVQSSCSMPHTAPAGLNLYTFTQVNAMGKTMRRDAGAFHNEAWALPGGATNVGAR